MSRLEAFLVPTLPRARVALLRAVVYPFVFVDVLLTTSWVALHRHVPTELYQPLFLARLLDLPEPTHALVVGLEAALLVAAAVAATGRLPRAAGATVFVLYLAWMLVAMSYGKVDHDRVGFLVALAVLPTVGRASPADGTRDEQAGWALRAVQLAVVATYFLAAFAKLRYGGLGWVNSATFVRAVTRRGSALGEPLLDYPTVLLAAQWGLMAFELASPLMLLENRVGRLFRLGAVTLHVVTYSTIGIIFLPHVVALLSFAPLERWWARARARWSAPAPSRRAAARPASSPAARLLSR